MENNDDLITLGLGIIVFLIGLILTIRKALVVKKNKVIVGEIYDRRSGYRNRYYPVIKYEINNKSKEYQSSQTTIFQVIGGKMRLVYNEKRDYIMGTFGEFFFMPVTVMIVGLFITAIMILYFISLSP